MKTAVFVFAFGVLLTCPAWAQGNAANGATLFGRQCAACHGKDGSGNTAMGKTFKLRDLGSAEVQNMTDTQLFDIIGRGKGKMPAYENKLGKKGIEDVIAHIRTFKK